MKCMENKCKHYIDNCWCDVFEMVVSSSMNCYGAFEKIGENLK